MKLLDLNGSWTMTDLDTGRSLPARVPGTVAATLIEHQVMPDPYWRQNEETVQPQFEADYEFSREFDVEPGALAHDQVLLHCDGLDTVAELAVNGAAGCWPEPGLCGPRLYRTADRSQPGPCLAGLPSPVGSN